MNYYVKHEPGTAWLDYPWVVKIGTNTIRSRHATQAEAADEARRLARGKGQVYVYDKMGRTRDPLLSGNLEDDL